MWVLACTGYEGYGNSKGRPSEKGLCLDAAYMMRYISSRRDVDKTKVWVYGESIGGAVAIWFTERYQDRIQGLIIENSFTSLLDMIKILHPILVSEDVLLSLPCVRSEENWSPRGWCFLFCLIFKYGTCPLTPTAPFGVCFLLFCPLLPVVLFSASFQGSVEGVIAEQMAIKGGDSEDSDSDSVPLGGIG